MNATFSVENPPQDDFSVGDRVDKREGYKFPGTVVSRFTTSAGGLRFVVEMDFYGLLHIFNGKQLKKTS